MSVTKPKPWKFWLAALGSIMWFILLQSLQLLNNDNYLSLKI